MRVALPFLLCALAAGACTKPVPEVALLLSSQHGERAERDARFFKERANELGLSVVTLGADDDARRQHAQVEDALARGARVLVVQPVDGTQAAAYVRLAHEHGARIIAYDRAIDSPDLDYYVSHDSYRVGVLKAEAALAATGGKGAYVLLSGPAHDWVAREITRGYENTLAPYVARGDVQVFAARPGAWSVDAARAAVAAALPQVGPKLHAVLANNSALARGAVEAIGAAGAGHVFVAGADSDVANLNLVCQGKQTLEILKDVRPLARSAAEVARILYDRESPKRGSATIELGGRDVPLEAARVAVVTSETLKAVIVDSGFVPASALPACKPLLALQ